MHWKEVAQIRFRGDRFDDHALDSDALAELARLQKIVARTAASPI